MKRTDLIFESAQINENSDNTDIQRLKIRGTEYIKLTVSDDGGEKPSGRYYTVFTEKGDIKGCLTEILKEIIPTGKALVAGLGNENVCSDSLGVRSLRYIPATAHLKKHEDFSALGLREVCVLEAGVTGKTGIESSGRISCIAKHENADLIIAIDSLACSSPERLCSVVQVTDTGISPGSGVGNDRKALNKAACGMPVIAIGVPTVIDLESFCPDNTEYSSGGEKLMVTPRNIDIVTERFARVIGTALSSALNPSLSEAEIKALIIE